MGFTPPVCVSYRTTNNDTTTSRVRVAVLFIYPISLGIVQDDQQRCNHGRLAASRFPNAAHESWGEGLICQSRLRVAIRFFILLIRVGAAGEAGLDSAILLKLEMIEIQMIYGCDVGRFYGRASSATCQ